MSCWHGRISNRVLLTVTDGRDGGGYFGVPLSDYAGWYLTVWLFYQVFALLVHFRAVGHGWRARDLHETTVVVMLFTMLFASALALLRWAAPKGCGRRSRSGPVISNGQPSDPATPMGHDRRGSERANVFRSSTTNRTLA
jgi:hypothetical protein